MSYARQLLDTYQGTVTADASVLAATIGTLSRQAGYDANVTRPLLEACVAICTSCGDECERHARHYERCRVCEQACRVCERACRELLEVLV